MGRGEGGLELLVVSLITEWQRGRPCQHHFQRMRLNTGCCGMVCVNVEGGDGFLFYRATRVGGGVLVATVRAFEGDCVATSGYRFVISPFNAPCVSTMVGFSGVRAGTDGTCGEFLFT